MQTDTPRRRGPAQRLLQREAARWWWAPLVAGIIWFLIAWLVLRANVTSLATVGILVGVVFLVAAVTEGGLGTFMSGGWKVLHYALAVVFLLAAIWSFGVREYRLWQSYRANQVLWVVNLFATTALFFLLGSMNAAEGEAKA